MESDQYIQGCAGKLALWKNKQTTIRKQKERLICSIYWFSRFKSSHHGRVQASNGLTTGSPIYLDCVSTASQEDRSLIQGIAHA